MYGGSTAVTTGKEGVSCLQPTLNISLCLKNMKFIVGKHFGDNAMYWFSSYYHFETK